MKKVRGSLILFLTLIYSQFLHPSTCSTSKLETQILELKIKAITSVELSSMSFNELPSLFFLYENLVTKRFDSVHKNDPKKFEEFRKIHQYHAIMSSFYFLTFYDVLLKEEFNVGDLDIISKKVNWTDQEMTKYGFLGKDKNGEFKFHEQAFADFFLAEYFYDNIVHPKDNPSDNEMELRLRFLLYVMANHYDRKPLMHYFTLDMFEDQNGEIFNDQVRMVMKYRFKHLLDSFHPDELDLIEKTSTIFQKDPEILKNLWGIDDNQPYFYRFFNFLTSTNKVYKLKEVAEKFFKIEPDLTSNSTKPQAYNMLRGKNQILNILYLIKEHENDKNFTKDILDVTKYQVSDEILTKLKQTENFLDFVDQSSYSTAEKREFYLTNSFDLISNTREGDMVLILWRRFQKYCNNDDLKGIITQKSASNETQLFLLPSHGDKNHVEVFLNLTKFYLNKDEIRDFLVQRTPINRASFLTRFMFRFWSIKIFKISYNFAKDHLTHEELKDLIFNKNATNLIHQMADNSVAFKFYIGTLTEFYTNDEILDMLMTTHEYNENILYHIAASGIDDDRRKVVADFLRETFKDKSKLRKVLGMRNKSGYSVLKRLKNSWKKEGNEPILELAKEVFTAVEIDELL